MKELSINVMGLEKGLYDLFIKEDGTEMKPVKWVTDTERGHSITMDGWVLQGIYYHNLAPRLTGPMWEGGEGP
jgi:hypothetical protein